MSTNNFILVENFAWLINNLEGFPGGRIVNGKPVKFTYNKRGRRDANGNFLGPEGGKRRIYRRNVHLARSKYHIVKTATVKVKFNSTDIECDEFLLYHASFYDKNLKEPYKASTNQASSPEAGERVESGETLAIDPATNLPRGGGSTGERVLITSKASFKNKTAPRYYVSCTCDDFLFTFKEQLIKDGYTLGTVSTGAGKTGNKNVLGDAICKHIYHVIKTEYADILKWRFEQKTEANAALMPWGLTPSSPIKITTSKLDRVDEPKKSALKQLAQPPEAEEPLEVAPEDTKKEAYKKQILLSLKHYNAVTSDRISAYKSPKDAPKHYRKYKFMVRWYGKTWAIVFTNPEINPDTSEYKELVPILHRTSQGLKATGHSPVKVYSYFTKDELLELIRTQTKELQQNQIDRIKSVLGIKATTDDSSWLTESLDYPTNISSILGDLLNG